MATAGEDTPSPETNLQPSDGEQVSDDAASAGPEDGLSKQDLQEDSSSTGRTLQHQISKSMREKEKKIGHRRVDQTGKVTYKKKPTSELMAAIQLGIGQSVGGICSKPERDVLMQDFAVVECVFFPGEGSNLTPAHHYSDFRFKTYAPIAFRYFRELFGIQADDFLLSLCHEPMQELSNPGASGSIFYLTNDDEFIIKTVQHKEAEFLQKLLPGYFLNLNQNPRTLLPKFYGLYCYQCGGKNIRFIVMNNLLPSCIKLHEKYDLKGSTYKRKASKQERLKNSPTLKDLDFMDNNPEGLLLEKETLDALMKTLNRDVRVLESFKIMDYSLLVGIHNLDQSARERGQMRNSSESSEVGPRSPDVQQSDSLDGQAASRGVSRGLSRAKSLKTRLANWSTTLESIQAKTDYEEDEDEDVPPGGIPARNHKGERLLLYLGIIDILQSYRLKKKLEHRMKALVIDGDTISVHRPGYYATRFLTFFGNRVFKRAPATGLKHSPSKKKSMSQRRAPSQIPEQSEPGPSPYTGERRYPERTLRTISFSDEQSAPVAVGGKPDIVPDVSPSSHTPDHSAASAHHVVSASSESRVAALSPQSLRGASGDSKRSELMTVAQSEEFVASKQVASLRHSPPVSLSESTPTHTEQTEGTASLTTSSPSCSSDVLADLALDRDLNSVSVTSLHSPGGGGGGRRGGGTSPASSTGPPPSNKTASSPEASFHSAETEPGSPAEGGPQLQQPAPRPPHPSLLPPDTEEIVEVTHL